MVPSTASTAEVVPVTLLAYGNLGDIVSLFHFQIDLGVLCHFFNCCTINEIRSRISYLWFFERII